VGQTIAKVIAKQVIPFLFRGNPAYYLRHPSKGAGCCNEKKKDLLFVMSDEQEFV